MSNFLDLNESHGTGNVGKSGYQIEELYVPIKNNLFTLYRQIYFFLSQLLEIYFDFF